MQLSGYIASMDDKAHRLMRKTPTQDRAIAKVEHILDSAEALIGERGLAALNTRTLADKAGIAVGSVYQYFTGQDQVVAAICERYFDRIRKAVDAEFEQVCSIAGFAEAAKASLEFSWKLSVESGASREVLYGIHAWDIVRETEWRCILANVEVMKAALQRILPRIESDKLGAFCTIICGNAGNISRMGVRFEHLREPMFEEILEMIEERLYALQRENDRASRIN